MQINTNNVNSYKQLKVKTNRTSFLCGNRNGHHNMELRTWKHIIGQHKKIKRWATRTTKKTRGSLFVLLSICILVILLSVLLRITFLFTPLVSSNFS